jgi:hypothetical protein
VRFDDSDVAFRRIPIRDVNPADNLPTSVIVKNSSDGSGMSVVMRSLLDVADRPYSTVLPRPSGFGLFAWSVGRLRELQFDVVFAPTDDQPAHANVAYLVSTADPRREWPRGLRRELIDAG